MTVVFGHRQKQWILKREQVTPAVPSCRAGRKPSDTCCSQGMCQFVTNLRVNLPIIRQHGTVFMGWLGLYWTGGGKPLFLGRLMSQGTADFLTPGV